MKIGGLSARGETLQLQKTASFSALFAATCEKPWIFADILFDICKEGS